MAIRFSINAHFEGTFGFNLVRRFKSIEKRPLAKTMTKAEAKAEAEIGVQKLVGTSQHQPSMSLSKWEGWRPRQPEAESKTVPSHYHQYQSNTDTQRRKPL